MTTRRSPVGSAPGCLAESVDEYDNIYAATCDNAYMGYACGLNSHGDVTITLTASGPPGVHLIYSYPSAPAIRQRAAYNRATPTRWVHHHRDRATFGCSARRRDVFRLKRIACL
jgi:hypothetical protein